MKILLDTCAFLWLTTDESELSDKAKQVFQDPDNSIYLSSVSVWEMLVKNQLESCHFRAPPRFLSGNNANSISSIT